MGLFRDAGDPDRLLRARMEQAQQSGERAQGEGNSKRPQRYRLYDRIADRVPLSAMNIIICATVLLLIIALVYGIATGSRP